MSKYYLALFNEETWNEFIKKGSSVYGTTFKKRRRMEKTIPGDFLICYVTKLSRFVGLLEITSKAYIDDSRIWESDIYPNRVNVCPAYILKDMDGIPISELKEELSIFKDYKNPLSWKGHIRNSLTIFQENDAKIIVEKLKEASNKQLF